MQLSNDSLSQILAAAKPQKLAERYQKRRSAVAMVMDQDDLTIVFVEKRYVLIN